VEINFQIADAPLPAGSLAETGFAYAARGNGKSCALALKENLVARGGTTCATNLAASVNAPRKAKVGGHDGSVAVVKSG
jgi:hypothetical protein